ncbi:MAG: BrnT family toxin [Pleurocapsa sp.]
MRLVNAEFILIDEERFIAVRRGNLGLLLVVVYKMRGNAVRLISARRATRQEAKAYNYLRRILREELIQTGSSSQSLGNA